MSYRSIERGGDSEEELKESLIELRVIFFRVKEEEKR